MSESSLNIPPWHQLKWWEFFFHRCPFFCMMIGSVIYSRSNTGAIIRVGWLLLFCILIGSASTGTSMRVGWLRQRSLRRCWRASNLIQWWLLTSLSTTIVFCSNISVFCRTRTSILRWWRLQAPRSRPPPCWILSDTSSDGKICPGTLFSVSVSNLVQIRS